MTIQLIGEIHPELRALGLQEGDIIKHATPDKSSTTGVVHFDYSYCCRTINCSVWPANYKILEQ